MAGIHDQIMLAYKDKLTADLITAIAEDDITRAGVVKIGELNGEPDPDQARISVLIFPNDPEQEISGSGVGNSPEAWDDRVLETEIGGGITYSRKFTVKCRCLFENTGEDLDTSKAIASQVMQRILKSVLTTDLRTVVSDGETVVRGAFGDHIRSSLLMSGGPPDSYDYHIKLRFEVWTYQKLDIVC